MDSKTYEIFSLFSLLRKLSGLNKQRVESFGLNNLESIILFHIGKIDNLTQKDLVDKLKMPKQTINVIILNLKENGLISMRPSRTDKRVKTLVLTTKGENEVAKINKALSISNQKIFDDLGEAKIRDIKANLSDLIETIEKNL